MLERTLEALYRRLGPWYPTAFVAIAPQASWPIAAAAVGFLALYIDMAASELAGFLALSLAVTAVSILAAIWRAHGILEPVRRWLSGDRAAERSVDAWRAAVGLPLNFWRHGWYLQPLLLAALPIAGGGVLILGASVGEGLFIYGVAAVVILNCAILNFFVTEVGMRPLVADIAGCLPPRIAFERAAIPLRWKLLGALPAINLITGFLAVGLTSSQNDVSALGLDALAAMAATFAVSLSLTLLVARSLRRPLLEMVEATDRVRDGELDLAIPLTTSDEVGELSAAVDEMVAGLSERERIRATLGTYLDPAVAERLVDEELPLHGEEVVVSALFLDVRDFTAFAESRPPRQVVAALNRLYDDVVPTIADHGGHVDKFIGDGLLGIFGAPEVQRDHADRALAAGLEIDQRVRELDGERLAIGIGISSGPVLVGNIGGGGRLDFSVIGDAVNLAARAEAAPRMSGDVILITAATKDLLVGSEVELEERPGLPLGGTREPVALHAPRPRVPALRGGRA